MKKKLFITFIVAMSVTIAVFAGLLINLNNTYGANKGEVPGTGFFIQEMTGDGYERYDVDSKGNIYFANLAGYVLVYDSNGKYLYTLRVLPARSTIYVIIDKEDKICVLNSKPHKLYLFNQNGQLISTIDDISSDNVDAFEYASFHVKTRTKPNGIVYDNNNGTITKTVNGQSKVVFTVPEWQNEFTLYATILIITIIALGIFIIVKSYQCTPVFDPEANPNNHINRTLHLK